MPKVIIAYATEKGTSKSIAEEICERCHENSINCELKCISEIDKNGLNRLKEYFILIGATTGDGEPPSTARKFWQALHQKTGNYILYSHIRYTVLGLGDTNYTNFCNFGKVVDNKLASLGAFRFYECGWADDETGLEDVVDPWIEGLFECLKDLFSNSDSDSCDCHAVNGQLPVNSTCHAINGHLPADSTDTTSVIASNNFEKCGENKATELELVCSLLPSLAISTTDEDKLLSLKTCVFDPSVKLSMPIVPVPYLKTDICEIIPSECFDVNIPLPLDALTDIFKCRISSAVQLTEGDSVKQTIEISLDLPKEFLKVPFKPGNSFGIIAENPDKEVNYIMQRLGLERNSKCIISIDLNAKRASASVPSHIPKECSVFDLLKRRIDLRAIPKKLFLRALIEYMHDDLERQRVKELVSKEGSAQYLEYVRKVSLTFIDFLLIFNSCRPPLGVLLEHLPPLSPRSYSLACYPPSNSGQIKFVFNVVEIEQSGLVTFSRRGICTGMIEKMVSDMLVKAIISPRPDPYLDIYLCKSRGFNHPDSLSTPIIMVGPGTGIAPFIGFLQYREVLLGDSGASESYGESWLFYGCRHRDKDYLYKDLLNRFVEKKVLTSLHVAFSRDNNGSVPCYVQHNIRRYGTHIAELILNKEAIVYVCGDAKNMAKDVLQTFIDILACNSSMSDSECKAYLAQLQVSRRYLQDVWL